MTVAEEVFQGLQLLKKSLVNETGILKWVAFFFGIGDYAWHYPWKDSQMMMSILAADSLWQKHRLGGTAFRRFIRMTPNPTVSMGIICVVVKNRTILRGPTGGRNNCTIFYQYLDIIHIGPSPNNFGLKFKSYDFNGGRASYDVWKGQGTFENLYVLLVELSPVRSDVYLQKYILNLYRYFTC